MKEEIISNLENPRQLEKMYRDNRNAFMKAFNVVYPDLRENKVAQIWNERLNFEKEEISWGTTFDLVFVITAAIIAGLVAKFPQFSGIDEDYFYPRHLAFIVFPFLSAYFAWKQNIPVKIQLIAAGVFATSLAYINFLPNNLHSDTMILACIHLPLLLWATTGFVFAGNEPGNYQNRLDFLRFNGEWVVMTTIILIAGAILSVVTVGLFRLIGLDITETYFQNVAIWGLAGAPIVGTYLVRTNPQLVNKVSPVVAKVFTPLVFIMLVIYLVAIVSTGKDPYNDREFLMIFNVLLIGVMAIILFAITASSKTSRNTSGTLLLLFLAIVTVIVNGIALSAILFRIIEWGITPNRLAVMGSNMLMLTNLVLVTVNLFKSIRGQGDLSNAENSIACFLPIYTAWAAIVTFTFPILFDYI